VNWQLIFTFFIAWNTFQIVYLHQIYLTTKILCFNVTLITQITLFWNNNRMKGGTRDWQRLNLSLIIRSFSDDSCGNCFSRCPWNARYFLPIGTYDSDNLYPINSLTNGQLESILDCKDRFAHRPLRSVAAEPIYQIKN
jgi:hypothetical protein